MSFLVPVAIALVVATVVAAVVTGHKLGIRRKAVFQLEAAVNELRRQLDEMEQEKRQVAGRIRALRQLRDEKIFDIDALRMELKQLADGGKAVGVSAGLTPRGLELEAAAA